MDSVPAIYLGRVVSKEHFRVFIYHPDGSQKLVESWDEFQELIGLGIWFATIEEAQLNKSVKSKQRKKNNDNNNSVDDLNDDFLSNTRK